ncbi:MAG: hypothetical protein JJU36_17345 [Phycisphaeraceae bacterium]|nr:hypothetical protein [Phycisphaeraceae bacterium]
MKLGRFLLILMVALGGWLEARSAAAETIRFTASPRGWYSGPGQVSPSRWATVVARITNSGEEDRNLTVLVRFPDPADDSRVHFVRDAMVPARTTLEVPVDVRVPVRRADAERRVVSTFEVQVDLLERRPGRELRLGSQSVLLGEQRQNIPFFTLSAEPEPPALIRRLMGGLRDRQFDPELERLLDRPGTGLGADELALSIGSMGRRHVPVEPRALERIGVLVITRTDDDLSAAQAGAIRHWLAGGGLLWIQVEQVDPEWIGWLLGSIGMVSVVERIELDRIQMRSAAGEEHPLLEIDDPVAMARIVAEGFEPLHEVDGWPASLIRSHGQGRILLTTLGEAGWPEALRQGAGEPLHELARWLVDGGPRTGTIRMARRQAEQTLDESIGRMAEDQIGYQVVSRMVVAGLLTLFVGLLAVGGLLLHGRGQLERMAVVGPVVAILVSLVVLTVGLTARRSAPLTSSTVVLSRVLDDGLSYEARGVVAYYAPERTDLRPGAVAGIDMAPAGTWTAADGTMRTHRLLRTRDGMEIWSDYELPPGRAAISSGTWVGRYEHPVEARVELDRQGASVRLSSPRGVTIEDPVLVFALGWLLPEPDGEGLWRLRAGHRTPPAGQFSRAAQLSGLQQRRQELLATWSRGADWPGMAGLRWLNWSTPDGLPVGRLGGAEDDTARDRVTRSSILHDVPVRIVRPAPGTEFTVPWFIWDFSVTPVSRVRIEGPRLSPVNVDAMAWENGRFVRDRQSAGFTVMRFSAPRSLTPMDVESLRFGLDIEALRREIRVYVRGDDDVFRSVPFNRTASSIELRLEGEALESLDLPRTGRWDVVVEVGGLDGDLEQSTWWMDRPRLEVAARTPGRDTAPGLSMIVPGGWKELVHE